MKSLRFLQVLSIFIILLTIISSGTGLFWQDEGEPFYLESVFGEKVEIFGNGLYAHDNFFSAPISKGTDAVTLFLVIPLFILIVLLNKKNSLKYRIIYLGLLSFILYYSASIAFGAALNNLFIVYLFLFSISLFSFITGIADIDYQGIEEKIGSNFPNKSIAIFLFFAGLSVFVWLLEIISFMTTGSPPTGLGVKTTEPTFILDIGIIAPAAFLGGIFLLKRKPLGYVISPVLLVLNALIGIVVISQTIFQRMYGVYISTGQLIAFVGIFVVMSLIASILYFKALKNIKH